MKKIPAESVAIVLASFLTFFLLSIRVDIPTLQRAVAVLLFVLLVLSSRSLTPKKEGGISKFTKEAFLFLTTLFIQLIILSTGNLKSPFLVLVHLFTLGVGFLVGIGSGFLFLTLSLVALLLNIYLDKNIQGLFLDDPGSLLLYLVSFLVIIPLSVLLTRYYYLKDTIVNILTREIRLREKQQESLLEGLNELILVTDKGLNVISANETAGKVLSIPRSAITHRPIFNILFLRTKDNVLVNTSSLPINKIVYSKESFLIENLLLFTKNTPLPRKVSLLLRPEINLEGAVDHLTFVISDNTKSFTGVLEGHQNLDQARVKQQTMMAELKSKLSYKKLPELRARTELIERAEHDLLMVVEIEDHSIEQKKVLTDVAEACKRRVLIEQDLSKILNVNISFTLLNFDTKDTAHLVPKGLNVSPLLLTAPFFSAYVDYKWFDVLLTKLLDIMILLTSGITSPQVSLTVDREGKDTLLVNIETNYPGLSPESHNLLFTKYYGALGTTTNLRLGSGLEGFIAKTLAAFLNIPLSVESRVGIPGFSVKLKISKRNNQS